MAPPAPPPVPPPRVAPTRAPFARSSLISAQSCPSSTSSPVPARPRPTPRASVLTPCDRSISKTHKSQQQHVCSECSTSFGEKGNLNRHIKSVQYVARPPPPMPRVSLTLCLVAARNRTNATNVPWPSPLGTHYSTYIALDPPRRLLTQLPQAPHQSGARTPEAVPMQSVQYEVQEARSSAAPHNLATWHAPLIYLFDSFFVAPPLVQQLHSR